MLTKQRQGYDPSVVQTVILLPVAVAGIVAVVQNSLVLAFSLAGLAAAVRFRNTLKDSKDAVYIFVAMGVGLAGGGGGGARGAPPSRGAKYLPFRPPPPVSRDAPPHPPRPP